VQKPDHGTCHAQVYLRSLDSKIVIVGVAFFPDAEAKIMGVCENCGNDYHRTFQIMLAGQEHTFDSFECAINALAPKCAHCGTRIVGHGMESKGEFFCCVHCAETAGIKGLRDHI
jgi:hypothetical protein